MKRRFCAGLLIAALFAPLAFANAAEVKPFVRGSWRAIVEQHAGQPIIVHFWGLTCGPCRHEMPEWGRLFAQTPDLRLITINADAVQSAPEAIQDFLDKSGLAGAENWNFDDGFGERLRYEIDPKWQGEIPITLLIGRDGGTRRIEGAAEMAEVRSWFEGQASTK